MRSRDTGNKYLRVQSTAAKLAQSPLSYSAIEAPVKKMKQHRDCARLEVQFIREVVDSLSATVNR